MNKVFLLAASLVMALTACQKDEMSTPDAATTSSFTVTIPQSGVPTRAVNTGTFGTGTLVNRCILEIYHDDQLYTRIEKGVSDKTVTFDNLRLVARQTYDFVFWADMADGNETNGFTDRHYTTSNLKSIKNRGTFVGNSDERDAFFASKQMTVTNAFTENITLTRPFGLLTVKTNDLTEIKDEALKPTGYTVTFKEMHDTFDASTGAVSGNTTITYTANELAAADGTISMDFLWATDAEAALSDFTMAFYNNGTLICENDAFTSIPVRRNYKTNVSGNLLTKTGTITVTIDPAFNEEDIMVDVDQVNTIDEANEAFKQGKTNVIVKQAPTSERTLYLPSTESAVSATFPGLTNDLNVQYAQETNQQARSGSKQPAAFYLTVQGSTANVNIETPNTTVTIAGQSYASVTAATAANTLVISEGTTVEKLAVKGGNVAVYGTLKAIDGTLPSGTTVTLHASTAEKLKEFAEAVKNGSNIYNKVVLDADIDFKGEAFSIDNARNIVLDGQGHKLSNYKVENTQVAGLFTSAVSVKVMNLTIAGADVKALNDGSGNAYAGAVIGRSYGTVVLDNVTVAGSKVEGVNKVGGMIGFVAEDHVEATNCKVTGSTVTTTLVYGESGQCGGFAGYLGVLKAQTCSFANCSVEDTRINAYMQVDHRTNGKFIGCFQGDQATDVVRIDNCSLKNVTLDALDETGKAHLSAYGDLLGGQRYNQGTVQVTNSPKTYSIAHPAQLCKFAEMANADKGKANFSNATVQLEANIDLTGKNWLPVDMSAASNFIFDGRGHTINGMTIEYDAAYGNGFFRDLRNRAVVRNVTFDNAKVSRTGYLKEGGGNVYGIVSGYAYATVAFENVHVTNSYVNGYGKVGGIIGMAADKAGITSFENCSVTNTYVISCYNSGGLIGLAQNLVTLKDCKTENVKWTRYPSQKEMYKELNTTLTDKDGNLVSVKGTYWQYYQSSADTWWVYAAFGDYYTDLYYSEAVTASGEKLADGLCHNK